MAEGKFVTYVRVSTERQGRSGLGLEAQRSAVAAYLNGGAWTVMGEFVEVESGAKDDRPQLAAAMSLCRIHGAVLLIAKLDRLSRDAHFLLGLQKAGVRFVAADMPEANELTIGLLAVVAQHERRMISTRTKAALAVKRDKLASLSDDERAALKAAGKATQLGGARANSAELHRLGAAAGLAARQASAKARGADLAPMVARLRAEGVTSLHGLAKALTAAGIPTARGATTWTAAGVSRLLATMAA